MNDQQDIGYQPGWCPNCEAPEAACQCAQAEDNWQPCPDCDSHDACWDFGCAIEHGIIEPPHL